MLQNSVRSYAKIYLMYIPQILKTSTISYVWLHTRVRSVCDTHFPSFKTYVMFVTRILFHLKRYICDKHSLSFKTLVMFATCILFHLKRYICDKHSLSFKTLVMFATCIIFDLKHSYCSRRAIFFIQNVRNVRNTDSYYIAICSNYYVLFIYLQRSSLMNL